MEPLCVRHRAIAGAHVGQRSPARQLALVALLEGDSTDKILEEEEKLWVKDVLNPRGEGSRPEKIESSLLEDEIAI